MAGPDPPSNCRLFVQGTRVEDGRVRLHPDHKPYGTLYTGVTNNLPERAYAHREGRASKFTRRYGVTRLVWFEELPMIADAIQRETSIKRWKRAWKVALIEKTNPEWHDLYETLV